VLELTPLAWAALAAAALIVGLTKTAVPGAGLVAVALFATALPAREATATLLLLLIAGDVLALALYRRHAEWRLLLRLAPVVIGGIALGALFLAFAGDDLARRVIGAIVLLLVVVSHVLRRRRPGPRGRRAQAAGFGLLAGFSTMVANAGGPVMSLYFVALRFDVAVFLGTSAWFFACVNLAKVPIVVGLGLLDATSLLIVACLLPAVLLGGAAGRLLAGRMNARILAWLVDILAVAGGVVLLLG
jgi:uncharacterized protein